MKNTKTVLITGASGAIGSAIGGRNHATVLHSCKAVTNMIETDKVFKNQIEELEKLITSNK
jgi:chromosomal replication initiator protein